MILMKSRMTIPGKSELKEHAKVIHVNINPEMLGLMVETELGIAADVKDFLPRLQEALLERGKKVDDFDTGLQLSGFRCQLLQRW